MKKKISSLLYIIVLFSTITLSCRKQETLNVDLSKYNADEPIGNSALDTWLTNTFLNEYNIAVIYRYNKYYTDYNVAAAPSNPAAVKAQMQAVLDGFILPYQKVAGISFVKKNIPKEWVLFGSAAYQSDGTEIYATAKSGKRITLYDINNFDVNNAPLVVNKLRVIHLGFAEALTQIVAIPADFKTITKSTYAANYQTTSDQSAQNKGYVNPRASSEAIIDFTETIASLLVNGQAWFDARANASTAEGKAALKSKEASVEAYFTNSLGIDFKYLQQEIQKTIRSLYKYEQASFPYWMGKNLFKTITINLSNNPVYTQYGISTEFKNTYQSCADNIAVMSNQSLYLSYIRLDFLSATTAVLYVNCSSPNQPGLEAKYLLDLSLNSQTGETIFTEGTSTDTSPIWTSNAAMLKPSIQPLLNYLTNNTFIADWMPADINADNFNSYGGFYVKDTSTNFFYGLLGQITL